MDNDTDIVYTLLESEMCGSIEDKTIITCVIEFSFLVFIIQERKKERKKKRKKEREKKRTKERKKERKKGKA